MKLALLSLTSAFTDLESASLGIKSTPSGLKSTLTGFKSAYKQALQTALIHQALLALNQPSAAFLTRDPRSLKTFQVGDWAAIRMLFQK